MPPGGTAGSRLRTTGSKRPFSKEGVGEAVRRRDGPFDDYSQGPPERQPRREHVIDAETKGGG